jgi:hypothetical protein
MLDPAAGAGAGVPSSQVLVAVPQPTASIPALAPWILSATLPPAAARPLAYATSAIAAKAPASFAISRWVPAGIGGVPALHAAFRVTVAPLALM